MAKKPAKKKKGAPEFGCPKACLTATPAKADKPVKVLEFGLPIKLSLPDGRSITIPDPSARRRKKR